MKRILLIGIAIFFHFAVCAEEIFKTIHPGRVFLVDNDGYFYVNSGNHSIAKYSPDGRLLLKMGQKGQGPSDIKRLGTAAINPVDKNIYVTELAGGNRWISTFSKEGKYLRELNCEMDWTKLISIPFIKFDRHGNFYLQLDRVNSRRHKDFRIGTLELKLVKFSPGGKKLKEIYSTKTDFFAEKGGKGNITIPFHNYMNWNIAGDKILVRENNSEFIHFFDLDGNLKKKISIPFEKEKVTQKDIDKWEEGIKSSRWGKEGIANGWLDLKFWKKRIPFPEYKPISGGHLFVDPRGNLYTMKYQGHYLNPLICAKINLSANEVSIFKFKQGESLLGIWKDYFFVMKWDGEENYIAVRRNEKEFMEKVVK